MSTRAASRTHPKVQARRAAVARERGRWRRRLAVATTALFTVGGLTWLAVQSSFLDLEQVEVRGARRVASSEVRGAAALEAGEPLLLIDRGAVARRVEALPWVERAEVSWSLPATLVVEVVERTPLGWVALDGPGAEVDENGDVAGGVAIVDETGRVLDLRGRRPERLMELEHPHGVPEPGERLENAGSIFEVAVAAPSSLRERVRAIRRASTGFVVEVDGVEIVRFGAPVDIVEKWSALEAVLDDLAGRPVYLVDVRVPSVPAVRELEQLPEPEPEPEPQPAPEPEAATTG